jgi:hypothetical protein
LDRLAFAVTRSEWARDLRAQCYGAGTQGDPVDAPRVAARALASGYEVNTFSRREGVKVMVLQLPAAPGMQCWIAFANGVVVSTAEIGMSAR